jgi:AraC-like DNA-binding protein
MTSHVKNMTAVCNIGEPTVAAGVVRAMMDLAMAKGADRSELARRSGIAPERLDDQDNRIPLAGYAALIKAGQHLAGDPALALHYAENVNLAEVSIVGLLGYASETTLEAFQQLNRYSPLVVDLDTGGRDRFSLSMDERGLWLSDNRLNPNDFPELSETAFGQMICGTRRFADKPFIREVHFTHGDPGYRDEYERILGAPVVFESDRNAALADPASTGFGVALQPRYVFGIFSKHAEALLEKLQSSKTSRGRVESLLMPMLHTGEAGMERVAAKLGCSRETLYRNLRAEGVSFEKLLDELRHKLALHYLSGGKLSVIEIAYLVGFSDPTAFSRAFKRWTGRSPRDMRG